MTDEEFEDLCAGLSAEGHEAAISVMRASQVDIISKQ